MSLIGSIAISMKVVTVQFNKGLANSSKLLKGFAGEVSKVGSGMGGLFAAAGVAAGAAGLYKMVKVSSDLTEATSMLQGVFGDSSAGIIADSELMAKAFGTSRTEFLSAAAGLGSMFKNMGYTTSQAATLSTAMVRLAGDISSNKNIGFDEALIKIQAAMAGEAEPLRRFGVDLTEVALKAQAVEMGMKAVGGEFDAAQKSQLRLAIIMRQTKDLQGDLARTSDEVAGAMRSVSGRVENLVQDLGKSLEPVAKSVLGEINTSIAAMSMYWEESKASVVAWGQTSVGSMGVTAESMGIVQKSIGFLADAWGAMKLAFFGAQSYITAGLSIVVAGLAKLVGAIESVVEGLGGVDLGLTGYLDNISKDLDKLSGEQWRKFASELAKPPPSEGINEYFRKAKDQIKAVRTEATKAGPDISKITPGNTAAKTAIPKFAAAAAVGTQEGANAVLKGRFGGGGAAANEPQKQVAQNTKRQVDLASQMLGRLDTLIKQGQMNVGALFGGNF